MNLSQHLLNEEKIKSLKAELASEQKALKLELEKVKRNLLTVKGNLRKEKAKSKKLEESVELWRKRYKNKRPSKKVETRTSRARVEITALLESDFDGGVYDKMKELADKYFMTVSAIKKLWYQVKKGE